MIFFQTCRISLAKLKLCLFSTNEHNELHHISNESMTTVLLNLVHLCIKIRKILTYRKIKSPLSLKFLPE